MATDKKRRSVPEENRTTADYYKLHSKAINDLIQANEENSPPVTEEELRQYRSGPKLRLTDWAKAILIKIWMAGSVCFFILWGTSAYIGAQLDLLFVFGIALGVVTDVLTNNILRYFARTRGGNDRWMMFPQKQFYTFFLNILYAWVLLAGTVLCHNLISLILAAVSGSALLGVEPILFGLIYTGLDLLLIAMKNTAKQIIADAKRNAKKI